jgi:hypothetical protein
VSGAHIRYVVIAAAGIDIGAGRFAKGENVYSDWLNEQAGALEARGQIAEVGPVPRDAVPPVPTTTEGVTP